VVQELSVVERADPATGPVRYAAALEAEVNQYIAELAAETDAAGRRLVVRNGHHRPRTVTTAAGPVEVTAPCVNDRRVDEATGERMRFSSKILPPWCRKSPKVSEVLTGAHLVALVRTGARFENGS